MKRIFSLIIVMVMIFGLIVTAHAISIVVPQGFLTIEGDSSLSMPFWYGRMQQVYAASEFTDINGPILISQMAFRGYRNEGPGGPVTSDVRIILSTTSSGPDQLSADFNSNLGSDLCVVYSGLLTYSSSSPYVVGVPNPFDIVIKFQTPFVYNPNLGNLLFDIINFTNPPARQFDATNSELDGISRVYQHATSGGVGMDSIGVITQFTFVPVEPITIDIKPGSYPNCFNINSHGVIPVAILGRTDFDVTQIDVSTLDFAGLKVRVKGNGAPQCSVEDVSGDFTYPEGAPDGFLDLVCQFVDDSTAWTSGDASAMLTGNLVDGTPISGTDEICIVP